MPHFCTVSGLEAFSISEWKSQVSETFETNFWIIGDSIIYSAPKGFADLKGVQKSLAINEKVEKIVSGGNKPYVQIEDYSLLTGSSPGARKYFSKSMNANNRLLSIIFCNQTLPLSIAVKLGSRFITSNKDLYVVKSYKDAIKHAIKISSQKESDLDNPMSDICKNFYNGDRSLSCVEVLAKRSWNVQTPEYSLQTIVIDKCILHSTCKGSVKSGHIHFINTELKECQSFLPDNYAIQYMIIDCSSLRGFHRTARIKYMEYLKKWNKFYPIKMYIIYNANTLLKTTLHLIKAFLPFKLRTAKNISQAVQMINQDRHKEPSKHPEVKKSGPPKIVFKEDIEKLIALIGSINWEGDGTESIGKTSEDHPFFFLYQSIKLIKEEINELFMEHKQVEEALKESEEFLNAIIENIPDMIFLKDADKLRFVRLNKAGEKLLGYSREEFIGKTDYDIFSKKEADLYTRKDREALNNGGLQDITEESVQTKHKGKRILHTKKIPIFNKNGVPRYLLGISEDITERIQAEEELKKLGAAVRQGPISIVITDPDGSIEYVNPKFCSLTEYSKQEVLGKNPRILQSGKTPKKIYDKFWKTILAGKDWHGELHNKKKNGDLYWENVVISPILNKDGDITHFLGVKEDITQRKITEKKMAASLLEKEMLLKEIHHRVKNNMQIISSLLSLQTNKLNDPDTIKAFVEAENRVHSMSLVHELLYQSDNFADINLQIYLEKLIEHISSMFIQKTKINIEIDTNNITLLIDQAIPCGLIVTELISNALRYAFPNSICGKIKIDVLQLNDNRYQMRIADNGIGFPKGYNWKNSRTLGLRLVRELVQGQLEGSWRLNKDNGVCWIIKWESC